MEEHLVCAHYTAVNGRRYSQRQASAGDVGYRLQAEFFQPFLEPQDLVLDYGCGKGGIAPHLSCKRVDGFDVNPEALACAKTLYTQTFCEYSGPAEHFYDVVISNHCLEHVPSPIQALTHVSKWLKPGGRAVFVVPHDCLDGHQCHFDPSDPDRHLYTWTPRTLGNLFCEAGFEVVCCQALRTMWHPRLYWLHQLRGVGPLSRRITCTLLKRSQVLCVAEKTAGFVPGQAGADCGCVRAAIED